MTTMTKAPQLTVRREIEATAEELFDAWLDAKSLGTWMRPGNTVKDSVAKVDARVGGKFSIDMHVANESIMHTGTYVEIDRPRRLVFTWVSVHTGKLDSVVTVEFRPGSKPRHTEVVLMHEGLPNEGAIKGHTGGWTEIFENLVARYAK